MIRMTVTVIGPALGTRRNCNRLRMPLRIQRHNIVRHRCQVLDFLLIGVHRTRAIDFGVPADEIIVFVRICICSQILRNVIRKYLIGHLLARAAVLIEMYRERVRLPNRVDNILLLGGIPSSTGQIVSGDESASDQGFTRTVRCGIPFHERIAIAYERVVGQNVEGLVDQIAFSNLFITDGIATDAGRLAAVAFEDNRRGFVNLWGKLCLKEDVADRRRSTRVIGNGLGHEVVRRNRVIRSRHKHCARFAAIGIQQGPVFEVVAVVEVLGSVGDGERNIFNTLVQNVCSIVNGNDGLQITACGVDAIGVANFVNNVDAVVCEV